ncbi:hypothetical protein ABS71_18440 [bacterium SCN 62-11]|nr:hypothetical protein [Candidatus Eremiobacteraeota bacterium]ODT58803.1 MAG: hypothetical protein ABS71_18440 [bacterium SCN 62-11]
MKKIVFAFPFLALTVTGWAQHKLERDPFVNLAQQQQVQHLEQDTHSKIPVITTQAHHQTEMKQSAPVPKINVLGLVTNSRQPKAIVAGAKSTYIVAQGDKLGDYRVARIDRSGITLAYKQSRYHLPLGE